MTWGYSGRRLDESQKGDEGSTHCIMDSIQKLAQELRGTLHMHIPPTGLWAHPVLGMPHTCTPHPMVNSLCMLSVETKVNFRSWLVSTHKKPD